MCRQKYMVPEEWNIAKVKSIFEKGNRNDVNKYRSVSMLNASYKIYIRIFNKRLQSISDNIFQEEHEKAFDKISIPL